MERDELAIYDVLRHVVALPHDEVERGFAADDIGVESLGNPTFEVVVLQEIHEL